MARILAIGIATLDIINSVSRYPDEDDEVRAVSQRLCRGGNATNTLVVLSQLGHTCHWGGVLADEPDANHIEADLLRHAINTDAVTRLSQGKVPTSYITHNLANGSRTIVHHRDLPEYRFAAFRDINLALFDWLHFEGRNVAETLQMLLWARTRYPALPISIEIEKERPDIQQLFAHANLLLFYKPFALGRGHHHATGLLDAMRPLAPQAALVCTWGAAGAWAIDHLGHEEYSTSIAPPQVVDTLGAGDTFNAAMIDGQISGLSLAASLTAACHLAGRKCGHSGFDFILKGTVS